MWLGGYERKSLYLKYKKGIVTWLLSKLIILFEKIILKNADFVFPVTSELMELANKRNVRNKLLSPNYVDVTKFRNMRTHKKRSTDKKFQIIYVGRFEEEKGIRIFLKAINLLSNNKYPLQLSLGSRDSSLQSTFESGASC